MEVTDIDKFPSLLQNNTIYGLLKFYNSSRLGIPTCWP